MKDTDPEIIERLSSIIYIRRDILEKVKEYQREKGLADESEAFEQLVLAGYEYVCL